MHSYQIGRFTTNTNIIAEKTLDFAVRIVNLQKHLTSVRKEHVLSQQILRCGTSIGANVAEAQRGQSTPDFAAKMCIALKEASETGYWLTLLHKTAYMDDATYKNLSVKCASIRAMLVASCKTAKENTK